MIEIEENWGAVKTIVPSNLDSLEKVVVSLSIIKKPTFMIISFHKAFILGSTKVSLLIKN